MKCYLIYIVFIRYIVLLLDLCNYFCYMYWCMVFFWNIVYSKDSLRDDN